MMTIRSVDSHLFGPSLSEGDNFGPTLSTDGLILNPVSQTSVPGIAALSMDGLVPHPGSQANPISSGPGLAAIPEASALNTSAAGTGFTVTIGTPASSGLSAVSAAAVTAEAVDPALGKLQNGLADIYEESQVHAASLTGAARAGALDTFQSVNTSAEIYNGMIAIDAVAANGDGAALLSQLKALGLQDGASYGAMAGGFIPLDALDSLAHAGLLAFARPVYAVTESAGAGSVVSQDVQAMHADTLQTTDHLTGAGITIGILSDSFNTSTSTDKYANDVTSGDLPAGINIIEDHPGGTDEGRAMAQLAYDVAPGAKFDFYTADTSEADFANGIVKLSQMGANIIVDDVRYFDEPMFQDGILAQAEETAYANGAMTFSSAGNYDQRAYDSVFRDSGQTLTVSGVTYELHDFDPGAGVSVAQSVSQAGTVNYILQWDQPFFSLGGAGATSDLAMFVFSGSTLIATFDSTHPGGDPIEIGGIKGNGTITVEIGVRQGTPLPNEIKYAMIGGDSIVNTFATDSATMFGHANSQHTIAVGAAGYYDTPAFGQTPPLGEWFTSKGGQEILFDDAGNRLATPEIRPGVAFTAADGGNTTFFSSDDSADADTLPNFYGTSAAAPNAAAIAALLMQADPHATRDQILTAMKASGIDITNIDSDINARSPDVATGTGTDAWTGTGLIQADAALSNLLSTVVTNVPALTGLTGTSTHAVEQGSAVTLLAGAPTITDSGSTTLASATVQITGGTFNANETSNADDTLSVVAGALTGTSITASYNASTETLTLSGTDTIAHYEAVLAAVQYKSSGDNPTDYGLHPGRIVTWTVNDGLSTPPAGEQNSGTTNINIDAVNDAPVNTLGSSVAATEDTPIAITGLSIADADANPLSATMSIALSVAHGTLTASTSLPVTAQVSGNGTSSIILTGTQHDLNAVIAAGGLTYTPNANYNGSDDLHIVTSDGGATGTGGTLSDTDDLGITIAAVNDPVTVTAPSSAVTLSENGSKAVAGVSISDVDATAAPNGIYSVTLSADHGELSLPTHTGLTLDVGTSFVAGSMSFHGTLADINTALASLTYIDANSFNGADKIHITATDQYNGITATGLGASTSDSHDVNVTIAAVNDAPVVVNGSIFNWPTIQEDTPGPGVTVASFFGPHFSDAADQQYDPVTNPTGSVANNFAGIVVMDGVPSGGGDWQWSTDGVNWINFGNTLGNPLLIPASTLIRFNPGPNVTGHVEPLDVFLVDDSAGPITTVQHLAFGPTSAQTQYSVVNIQLGGTITPVDDAPVNNVPGTQTVDENASFVFSTANSNAISITDVDSGAGALTVTLSAAHGTLTLAATTGLTFTSGDGNADGSMTFSGNVFDIDAALDGLTYTPNANYHGSDSISIVTNDNGNTGAGTTTGSNLIVNGSFETQDGSNSALAYINASPADYNGVTYRFASSLFGWSQLTAYNYELNTAGTNPSFHVPNGNVTIDMEVNPGEDVDLYQDIPGLAAGHQYVLTFAVAQGTGGSLGSNPTAEMQVIWNGVVVGTVTSSSTTPADYTFYLDAAATGTGVGGENRLEFKEVGTGSDARGTNLDNVQLLASSSLSSSASAAINVIPPNQAPSVGAPTAAAITYTENAAAVALMQGATITDPDSPANFSGGSLTIAATGAADGEITFISGNGFTLSGSILLHNGSAIGTITGLGTDSVSITGLTVNATPAVVNALATAFQFDVPGDTPNPADRTVTLTFDDGGNTGFGGHLTGSTTQIVHVTAVNDAPVAHVPGAQLGAENTNLVLSSANGDAVTVSDVDAQGGNETVTLTVAHGTVTLPNENNVSVTGDGTAAVQITGTIANINAVLDGLAYKGSLNYAGTDTLTVNVNDNGHSGTAAQSDTETVAISLPPNGFIGANSVHNTPSGTPGNDMFWFAPGGTYTVNGLAGSDLFYFGGGMTSADQVDGGPGVDQIALQGDYWTTPLVLGAGVVNVETIYLMPGNDTRAGDTAGNHYSYNITTNDANVAAGQEMLVDGSALRSGEDFTFNGSAETNGFFYIYAGAGVDNLTGGHGNDVFLFNQGTLGATDHVDGGPGINQLALRGDYNVTFGATQIAHIDDIYLVSAHDRRLAGGGTDFTYHLTMNDGNVVPGQQMTIDGSALHSAETLTFDGSAEMDGSFRVFGGAGDDSIIGSHGGDILSGGLGADTLTGGPGNDTFLYRSVAESTPTSHDTITDFTTGDIIDLTKIDANTLLAGQQHFTFIGSNAFDGGGHAGELQAVNNGSGNWTVSGDVNGDGVADFQIIVHVADTHPLTAADFHL